MKAGTLTRETIMELNTEGVKYPEFRIGDTIEVGLVIQEAGKKDRIQKFEGDVIAFHNNGVATTFTVRRISANNVGVEKIFPYYSPTISSIKVMKRGIVRRAKLHYIRDLVGKASRIKERVLTKEQKAAFKEAEPQLEQ